MSAVGGLKAYMMHPTFRAVVTGMTGYFLYPKQASLARIADKYPWLRYVFLFFLVWQGQGELHITRSLIAVAIIYALVTYAVPAIDK